MLRRKKAWVKPILTPSFQVCRAKLYFPARFNLVQKFLKKLNRSIRVIYLYKPQSSTSTKHQRKMMNNTLAFSIKKRRMPMTQACNTRKRTKISSRLITILKITPLYETRQASISIKHLRSVMMPILQLLIMILLRQKRQSRTTLLKITFDIPKMGEVY